MISMTLYLKNGHKQKYDEINKIQINNDIMTISTFKSQYVYVNINEISLFEIKYPQSKAPKAFAIFKQIIDELGGGVDEISS